MTPLEEKLAGALRDFIGWALELQRLGDISPREFPELLIQDGRLALEGFDAAKEAERTQDETGGTQR